MKSRKSRLSELEAQIRKIPLLPGFRRFKCEDCGEPWVGGFKSTRCEECQKKRNAARREQSHERRMGAQRARRRKRAGLRRVVQQGQFRVLVPVKRSCQHCHREYVPKRSTSRFCSTKCRVYWNRENGS
jgi:hypothetical protein